jgi:CMP-N-acetylneuraminic acid synthetase
LLELSDLRKALVLVKESPVARYSFPVASFPSAIQRALTLEQSGRLRSIHPENELVRSQDLEPAFFDAGQFYWAHLSTWKENARVQSAALGLPIPLWRVVDIDTAEDWRRAELIYAALRSTAFPDELPTPQLKNVQTQAILR